MSVCMFYWEEYNLTVDEQLDKLTLLQKQVEEAKKTANVILMGDFNFDRRKMKSLGKDHNSRDIIASREKRRVRVMDRFRDRFRGDLKLKHVPCDIVKRSSGSGNRMYTYKVKSILDHFYVSHKKLVQGGSKVERRKNLSDHYPVQIQMLPAEEKFDTDNSDSDDENNIYMELDSSASESEQQTNCQNSAKRKPEKKRKGQGGNGAKKPRKASTDEKSNNVDSDGEEERLLEELLEQVLNLEQAV